MLNLSVAIVAALALLLQVGLPSGAFSAPPNAPLALGSFCHAAQNDSDPTPQPFPGHDHEHCLLCQVGTISFLLPPSPPRLPTPAVVAAPATPLPADSLRGAVHPAYASRAPPAIG